MPGRYFVLLTVKEIPALNMKRIHPLNVFRKCNNSLPIKWVSETARCEWATPAKMWCNYTITKNNKKPNRRSKLHTFTVSSVWWSVRHPHPEQSLRVSLQIQLGWELHASTLIIRAAGRLQMQGNCLVLYRWGDVGVTNHMKVKCFAVCVSHCLPINILICVERALQHSCSML